MLLNWSFSCCSHHYNGLKRRQRKARWLQFGLTHLLMLQFRFSKYWKKFSEWVSQYLLSCVWKCLYLALCGTQGSPGKNWHHNENNCTHKTVEEVDCFNRCSHFLGKQTYTQISEQILANIKAKHNWWHILHVLLAIDQWKCLLKSEI